MSLTSLQRDRTQDRAYRAMSDCHIAKSKLEYSDPYLLTDHEVRIFIYVIILKIKIIGALQIDDDPTGIRNRDKNYPLF